MYTTGALNMFLCYVNKLLTNVVTHVSEPLHFVYLHVLYIQAMQEYYM